MEDYFDNSQIEAPMQDDEIIQFYDDGMKQSQQIIDQLKSVDPVELLQRIRHFQNLNIKNMEDEEIRKCFYDVLLWNNRFFYLPNFGEYPAGTTFFRVRKVTGSIIPLSNFSKVADCWEAPEKILTTPGRLNKPHESLLYTTALDPVVPIHETHIKENDWYALIKYVAQEPIKVNIIGGDYDYSKYGITDKAVITVHEIYNNFFQTEFSRDVGVGTEYLYRVSELITKEFFDLPPDDIQDAWAYSSMKDKRKYNVCFRPNIAHKKLVLNGAMICKKGKDDSISVSCVAVPFEKEDRLEYYCVGSPVQQKFFPEISFNANNEK